MASHAEIPPVQDLMWPTVVALRRLGGSAPTDEISEGVLSAEGLADDRQQVDRDLEDQRSTIDYRLGWARTYLSNIGAIENSARGVWSLTALGRRLTEDEIPGRLREYTHRCSR